MPCPWGSAGITWEAIANSSTSMGWTSCCLQTPRKPSSASTVEPCWAGPNANPSSSIRWASCARSTIRSTRKTTLKKSFGIWRDWRSRSRPRASWSCQNSAEMRHSSRITSPPESPCCWTCFPGCCSCATRCGSGCSRSRWQRNEPPPHVQDAHRPERGGGSSSSFRPSSGPGSPVWTAGTPGGRKGRLADTADRLVFILVYFRLYPIQAGLPVLVVPTV